jgi:hypothetical protein
MDKSRKRFSLGMGSAVLLGALSGCTMLATVEVKPSDCINPPAGDCAGGATESRILDVRLYQLKQAVDPCSLDLESFAQGKDLEALKSALAETANKEPRQLAFKVTANEPRSLGSWEIGKDTSYVLAVAIGRGRSKNSTRLIPIEHMQSDWKFPTLHFRGYDICLNQLCNDHAIEDQCHR